MFICPLLISSLDCNIAAKTSSSAGFILARRSHLLFCLPTPSTLSVPLGCLILLPGPSPPLPAPSKMSCIQLTCQPHFSGKNVCHSQMIPLTKCSSPSLQKHSSLFGKFSTRVVKPSVIRIASVPRYHHCAPVCLFGGKGKPDNENETSPWKAIEKTMGSFKKEQSIEDVLRQQIEKQEFFDDGGSDGRRPGGGGGGGDSGDPEDEGFSGILDETLQVVLATIGFIFLYIYIINGEDINVLVKDLLKFVFRGQKSFRLKRIMYQWRAFFKSLNKKEEEDPYWLERAILTTPTWWDSPEKYRRILRAYLAAKRDQSKREQTAVDSEF